MSTSYSSKKSYGNKTPTNLAMYPLKSYSSKKSYGNKTRFKFFKIIIMSYSSKKSYGNKTLLFISDSIIGLILAKNHMVTKLTN